MDEKNIKTTLQNTAQQHAQEVNLGERFELGKNWSNFLQILDEDRIAIATESLKTMLETKDLSGKTFLDIGSGSGLFSLAARRLGAQVHSFDFDSNSFACTKELKRRYFDNDENWTVEQGSVLDKNYIASIGEFDIVYSWGVLHHTGDMWTALENASLPVSEKGKLYIAIYNDTGSQVKRWKWIKKTYCELPQILKSPFALAMILPDEIKNFAFSLITFKPISYFQSWTTKNSRGMNHWYDIIDWVGGYPYEVASPDELFDLYKSKGFKLLKMKCKGVGLGCHEMVFEKE